jgi:hypothetical protein
VAERVLVEAELAHRGGRVAAADDGQPVDGGDRLGHPAGAGGERRQLEDAHRAVPEDRARRRRAAANARPTRADVEAHLAVGIASADDDVVSASALNSGDDDVDRQHELAGLGEQPPAGVDLVLLQQRVADLVALRGEEREAHAAADQQPVDLGQQRLDDAELVETFEPPSTTT